MRDYMVSMEKEKKENVLLLFLYIPPLLCYMVELDNSRLWRGLCLKRLHATFFLNISLFALYLPCPAAGQGVKLKARNPSEVTSRPRCLVPGRIFLQDQRANSRPSKLLLLPPNPCVPQLGAIQGLLEGEELLPCEQTPRDVLHNSWCWRLSCHPRDSSGHNALPGITSPLLCLMLWCSPNWR